MKHRVLALGLLIAAVGAAAHGTLLLTRDQSLSICDLKSGKETRLFNAPANQFVTFPTKAKHPHRKQRAQDAAGNETNPDKDANFHAQTIGAKTTGSQVRPNPSFGPFMDPIGCIADQPGIGLLTANLR